MSNVKFLVFEGGNTVLDMEKMSVFKNGQDMPWSYYEADVDTSQGMKHFMYTSKSSPGPNGEKAGVYVSEIKRWIPVGNNGDINNLNYTTDFVSQTISNPSLADYKKWGWPIKEDEDGNEIIPKFGDFTFKPHAHPDFEATQNIAISFKFGFGLNGTCYNFASETAQVCVYNLSCPPKLFCTTNRFCEIKYNKDDDSWGPDLEPADSKNCLECDLEEGKNSDGTNKYAYMLVCVEAGEKINLTFLLGQNSNIDSLKRINILDEDGQLYDDTRTSDLSYCLPYKANVPGGYDEVMGTNLLFDFYMIKFRPTDNHLFKRYNKNELIVNLRITPKSGQTLLNAFACDVDVKINLLKQVKEPFILDANTTDFGYSTSPGTDYDNSSGFRRQQIIVTDKEAIKYGLKNNDPLLPAELMGLTQEEACKAIAKSKLTDLEKCIYDYILSLKDRIEDLAYYYSVAKMVVETQIGSIEGDINNYVSTTSITNAITAMRAKVTTKASNNGNKLVTLEEIKADGWMSQKFQDIVNGLMNSKSENGEAPWNWSQAKDCSDASNLKSLVDNSNVENALRFALFDYKLNGVENKYLSKLFGLASLTDKTKRYEALDAEFHGFSIKDSSENDMSCGESYSRPAGISLDALKCKLNPVDAATATYYLCNVISDGSGNCGIVKWENGKSSPLDPTKEQVDKLLYATSGVSVDVGAENNTETRGPSLPFQSVGDIDVNGYARKNATNQFYKKDDGKHEFSTAIYDSGTNGYATTNRINEWTDISGLIRIPDASDGKYYDVCIDGVELKETVLPFGETTDKAYEASTVDKRHNNAYTDEIKNSRNTQTLKAYTNHLNILTHEKIQFVRFGHMVRFFIDEDDADHEKTPVIELPSIEIKERGDPDGTCTKVFDDLCISLANLQSTLQVNLDYTDNNIRSGTTFGKADEPLVDGDAVTVTRWNEIHVPVTLDGLLEKCECFSLCLEDDCLWGARVDASNECDVSVNISSLITEENSNPTKVPQQCEDEKFQLQYKYNDNGFDNAVWKSVDGVEFCYTCHNKKKANVDNDTGLNSSGKNSSDEPGDYTLSSNVEGLPSFRLVLPTQGKIVNYADRMYNINNASPFKAVLRSVDIKLKYKNETSSSNTQEVNIVVKDDDYQPKITTKEFDYNRNTLEQENNDDPSGCNVERYTPDSADNIVAIYGTQNGPENQEGVPDYSKLIKCDFDLSDLSASKNTVRKVNYLENLHGIEFPVAEINFSNFKINGEYAADANITNVFQHQKDEIKYLQNGLMGVTYENTDNERFNSRVPRIIPANPNYEIRMVNNNTKALLIRKTPFNYEEWMGSEKDETIIGGMDMWNEGTKEPIPELVSVRISYRTPDEAVEANFTALPEHKDIHFYVCPADRKEIRWTGEESFAIQVGEGEGKRDITNILSATLHGKSSDDIKYYIRGFVTKEGDVSFHSDLSKNCAGGDYSGNVKKMIENANTATFGLSATEIGSQRLFLALDANNEVDTNSEIQKVTNTDLKEYLVNGRLNIYHEKYNVAGSEKEMFDAYEQKYYGFFIEAVYHNTKRDQSCVESCVALVNIHVNPPKSGFNVSDPCQSVKETMGQDQNKTAEEHNPYIYIRDFISNVTHEDSGETNDKITTGSTNDLSQNFKVNICDWDEALELCHVDSNILNSYFKLKDIDSNKTTETAVAPSTSNAKFAHYNYERQDEYKIQIELCLNTLTELPVTKCTNNYVCGFGDVDDSLELRSVKNGKTCSFLADLSGDERAPQAIRNGQLNDTRLYYFKNPETHLYEGPLSTQPYLMEQLSAKRTLFNKKDLKYAYVRVLTSGSNNEEFTALYKTSNFVSNMEKAPKPADCVKHGFSIKVTNGLDKPQSCPQPYLLRDIECHDYCSADPTQENIIDADDIMVEAGDTFISYVFTNHQDFYKVDDMSDVAPNKDDGLYYPPNSTTGVAPEQRTIHYPLQMNQTNSGMYSGSADGSANNSIRFGKFDDASNTSIVPLVHYVEFHDGCIDASGTIETSVSNYIGSRVDHSGTVARYTYKEGDNCTLVKVEDSDRDLFQLNNVKRNRYHETKNYQPDSTNTAYTTAELAFGKDFVAEPDMVYRFSVATVLNVHATQTDISYNDNMVDAHQRYYPKVTVGTNKRPQTFQQYVYDSKQEAVVTLGWAQTHESTLGGLNSASNSDRFSAPLLVCRAHFVVCTKDGELVIEEEE